MPSSAFSALQQVIRRLSSGFILAFHEIAEERFLGFMDGLECWELVPLDTIIARAKSGRSTSGLFAITVDDCVGANSRSLGRVMECRRWPATFYAPTHYLDSGEGMPFQWWFKLQPFLAGKIIHLPTQDLDFTTPRTIKTFFREMEFRWHTQRRETYVSTIEAIVASLKRDYGIAEGALQPPAPLSWPEVTRLSRNGYVQFGSHGVSHTAMSALSEDELEFETQQSKRLIEEHTGRRCRHFAYPFGSPRSIGAVSPKIVARHFDSAVTMSLGPVDRGTPWLTPRIPLYPENSNTLLYPKIILKCWRRPRSPMDPPLKPDLYPVSSTVRTRTKER